MTDKLESRAPELMEEMMASASALISMLSPTTSGDMQIFTVWVAPDNSSSVVEIRAHGRGKTEQMHFDKRALLVPMVGQWRIQIGTLFEDLDTRMVATRTPFTLHTLDIEEEASCLIIVK